MLLTVGSFVFSVALVGLAWSRGLLTALPMMLVIGWGSVTTLALMNTLIQLTVPNALRGRVFSTYLWALQGVAPVISLFVGWLTGTKRAPHRRNRVRPGLFAGIRPGEFIYSDREKICDVRVIGK